MRVKEDKKKQAWMREYERLLLLARPELQGSIDWYTATYHYNENRTPAQAIEIFFKARQLT